MADNDSSIKEIARDSLKRCYRDGRVIASPKVYNDFWARDSFFAMPGMLDIGDGQIVKETLELFMSYQNTHGKIPRKIIDDINVAKYLFKVNLERKRLRPIYISSIWPFKSVDGNALFIRAVYNYLDKTGDIDFVSKNIDKIRLAFAWYKRVEGEGGLIKEFFLSNWMDTVFKSGYVLYSNVLYCEAAKVMALISAELNLVDEVRTYKEKHQKLKDTINSFFWAEDHYCDVLGFSLTPKNCSFDVAGNLMACYFNVADESRKKALCHAMLAHKINQSRDKLFRTSYPEMPFWRINPLVRIVDISDYQNSACWSWINALAYFVLKNNGFKEEAHNLEETLASIYQRDGEVGELYFPDGKVYIKKHWESASPMAWGSGMTIELFGD